RIYDGDYLSFQYGSSPTRYALHQIMISNAQGWIQFNASNETAMFEVTPNIRVGYALETTVRLVEPTFKAIIVPESSNLGRSGQRETSGISFTLLQTLRN